MGMENAIDYADQAPTWLTIKERLIAMGKSPQMRLIDNMPAFLDEDPEEGWREIRVTLGEGMITIRREQKRISVVVWGNATDSQLRDRDLIVAACKG